MSTQIEKTEAPGVGAIAPWFGGNRLLAHAVGPAASLFD